MRHIPLIMAAALLSSCHKQPGLGTVGPDGRCAAYESARRSGGSVDVRDGLFLAAVHPNGKAVFYDTACNYPLLAASFDKGELLNKLKGRVNWSEEARQRGEAAIFYLMADGNATFRKGEVHYLLDVQAVRVVAPIPADDQPALLRALKAKDRIMSDQKELEPPTSGPL
jgi:hypothetical protein